MYFSSLDVNIDCSIAFDHSAAPDCPIARKLSPSFPITLFFTKKKISICDFAEVCVSIWTFWSELYMAEVLTISNSVVPTCKFEVLIAQPLPKLATPTTST